MTVLVGGLRALERIRAIQTGVFTDRPETLTNDSVNLLEMSTEWKASASAETCTRAATAAQARSSGPPPPSTSFSVELPAPSDRGGYACDDAKEKFVRDSSPRGTKSWISIASTWSLRDRAPAALKLLDKLHPAAQERGLMAEGGPALLLTSRTGRGVP